MVSAPAPAARTRSRRGNGVSVMSPIIAPLYAGTHETAACPSGAYQLWGMQVRDVGRTPWSAADVVLANGRVIDPESGLDAIRHVGIRGLAIAAVSASPLQGKTVVDAKGLVVAPGFIDLHSHGQTPENYLLKARDGVTTALEMEVGVHPVDAWYRDREGRALINFGASSGEIPARMAVMHDSGTFLPRDKAVERAATAAEQTEIFRRIRSGLAEGALGIGLGIAYIPPMSRAEVLGLFKLAAQEK